MTGWIEFTLSAALLAGLGGGAHCAAMCGPLLGAASASSAPTDGRAAWLARALAYNAGRIASYCAAGGLTGALGAAGLALRGGPAAQQLMLAVMSASLILISAYLAGFTAPVRVLERVGAIVWRGIEPGARHFLPAGTPARAFGLGLVWGWLPCGMVYAALIAALATADPLHGAALMTAFGLGTLPNLLVISASFRHIPRMAKSRVVRAVAATVIAAVGVAGIARATQPAEISVDGSWCLQIPGLATLLGWGA